MIAGTYIFVRVMIFNVLLKAQEQVGGSVDGQKMNKTVQNNFMYISSILYHVF